MSFLSLAAFVASSLSSVQAESFGARDIWHKDDAAGQSERTAAKFILQLIEGQQQRRVSMDHTFRTGDEFQFVLTPNREIYLYVVNINPKGVASCVWPSETQNTNNRLAKGAETRIPTSGTFQFSGATGEDWLLVILSPFKQRPNLDRLQRELPDYRKAPGHVVEYPEIHIPPRKFGARGNPGLTDDPISTDPATYGAQRSSGERVLVYPYLLQHQPRNGDKKPPPS